MQNNESLLPRIEAIAREAGEWAMKFSGGIPTIMIHLKWRNTSRLLCTETPYPNIFED
jgi:hypothetical protein